MGGVDHGPEGPVGLDIRNETKLKTGALLSRALEGLKASHPAIKQRKNNNQCATHPRVVDDGASGRHVAVVQVVGCRKTNKAEGLLGGG